MKDLKLPHRMVLLNHSDPQQEKIVPEERMQNIITFSAIVETILMGKIKFKEGHLFINDDCPTPHSMINEMIQVIGRSPVNKTLKAWVEDLSVQIPFYLHVRDNLVENRLLHIDKRTVLGITVSKKYSLKDPRIVTDFIQYLESLEITDETSSRDLLSMIFLQHTELEKISFLSKDVKSIFKEINFSSSMREIIDVAFYL
ncbi:MAG: GPP34 family phosphoprotein [Bacteroidales bacterium]|nr:GPP34 family phosphoprotein [Bacteroidales bacterium]MCF8326705.1 GPP34 family phosphoprotein [Bacteroidales bacterium]